MEKTRKVCIDKIIGQPPPQYITNTDTHAVFRGLEEPLRAAIVFQKKWPNGRPLTITFLEGDSYVQEKVKKAALEWTSYVNLKFQFVDEKDADIQISFQQGAGSWSTIGIDANTVAAGEATMNFGWLDETTPDKEYSRVVKHEFGHALGLIHEHQNPSGGIKWDKELVYKDLGGPPNNWDNATIDRNMFARYSKNITQYTSLDPNSIMTYFIPAEWTTDRMSFGENVFDLSEQDKDFMKSQYGPSKF